VSVSTCLKEALVTYAEQWKALSSRIHGLVQAGLLYAQLLAVRSSDTYGSGKRLREQGQSILKALRSFRDCFRDVLPPTALCTVDRFLEQTGGLITNTSGTHDALQEQVKAVLVSLASFETELSFALSDVQQVIHRRSERVFEHLQRSIVVDEEFQEKWKEAFQKHERACEKLGAVHLLLHGIWAFKVDASGARTDLVFEEPITDLAVIQRCADGLVLTEWKKAEEASQARQRFEEARSQAEKYVHGPLAASELTGYRYAVVVSNEQVDVPDDLTIGDVLYRHINIAVNPRTPSRASRQRSTA